MWIKHASLLEVSAGHGDCQYTLGWSLLINGDEACYMLVFYYKNVYLEWLTILYFLVLNHKGSMHLFRIIYAPKSLKKK